MMKNAFEIAGGTIKGRLHKADGKNNQDAYYFCADENLMIGIVSDGCGSGQNSEVGAKLGSRLIAEMIRNYINLGCTSLPRVLEEVRLNFLVQLQALAKNFGGSFSQTVVDYFLFTLIGFVITEKETMVFSLGDGVVVINGEIKKLGPFPNNAPPYIAYGITNTSLGEANPELLQFKINYLAKTEEVENLLIGTDGVDDLIASVGKNLPGKELPVGELNQFWLEDKYFRNVDMMRRRLAAVNNDSVKYLRNVTGSITEIKKENGLLLDDTTLVVVRRKISNP